MGPNFAINMTRDQLFSLSLSKKRPKNLIPQTGCFDHNIVFLQLGVDGFLLAVLSPSQIALLAFKRTERFPYHHWVTHLQPRSRHAPRWLSRWGWRGRRRRRRSRRRWPASSSLASPSWWLCVKNWPEGGSQARSSAFISGNSLSKQVTGRQHSRLSGVLTNLIDGVI